MHKETHTNPLKEHFIWTGSTYQPRNLWGTVEHGQTQIMGRILFWKADEVLHVYFFLTASGSMMKTTKLLLVKSVPQRFWSSCFSPKHLGGCYNSFICYCIYTRTFPCLQLESPSLWLPSMTVLTFSVEICSNTWLKFKTRFYLLTVYKLLVMFLHDLSMLYARHINLHVTHPCLNILHLKAGKYSLMELLQPCQVAKKAS